MRALLWAMMGYAVCSFTWTGGFFLAALQGQEPLGCLLCPQHLHPLLVTAVLARAAFQVRQGRLAPAQTWVTLLGVICALCLGLLDAAVCSVFLRQIRALRSSLEADEPSLGLSPDNDNRDAAQRSGAGVWQAPEWLTLLVVTAAWSFAGWCLASVADLQQQPLMVPTGLFVAPMAALGALLLGPTLINSFGWRAMLLLSLLAGGGSLAGWQLAAHRSLP